MVDREGSDLGSGLLEVVQAHDRIAWLTAVWWAVRLSPKPSRKHQDETG
jgi:hypothetical protein